MLFLFSRGNIPPLFPLSSIPVACYLVCLFLTEIPIQIYSYRFVLYLCIHPLLHALFPYFVWFLFGLQVREELLRQPSWSIIPILPPHYITCPKSKLSNSLSSCTLLSLSLSSQEILRINSLNSASLKCIILLFQYLLFLKKWILSFMIFFFLPCAFNLVS